MLTAMIEERLKSLVEKRTIEAARKELTKKIHIVVKAFGKPVVEQAMSYTMLPDFWELDAPEILEGGDDNVYLKGYYFDGLSRGINLTIKLMFYDMRPTNLEAHYNGIRVYWEVEGELRSYIPHQEWEDALNRLHGYATPVEAEKTIDEAVKEREAEKKKTQSVIQKFKALWGY